MGWCHHPCPCGSFTHFQYLFFQISFEGQTHGGWYCDSTELVLVEWVPQDFALSLLLFNIYMNLLSAWGLVPSV